MAATNTATFPIVAAPQRNLRDLAEPLLAFAFVMLVLWLPTRLQMVVGPFVLLTPLVLTLMRHPGRDALGLSWRRFFRALWILPLAAAAGFAGMLLARYAGTFHLLHDHAPSHMLGYVLWTIYQQFLLQDYFLPRLTRVLSTNAGVAATASLFALAHLPNIPLTIATLVWGVISCWLFRRYKSLLVLGLAQGILGLCIGICVPDAMIHHMRVGLGYWRYHG